MLIDTKRCSGFAKPFKIKHEIVEDLGSSLIGEKRSSQVWSVVGKLNNMVMMKYFLISCLTENRYQPFRM